MTTLPTRQARHFFCALLAVVLLFCCIQSKAKDCEALVAAIVFEGDLAHQEFLRRYKNDNQFALWLRAQGLTIGRREMLNNRYYDDLMNAVRNAATPGEKQELLRQRSKTVEDELLERYLSEAPQGENTLTPQVVTLKNFLREQSTYRKKNQWETVETNQAYQAAVANLRKGDRLIFSDREFVLSDFLGQGNTTHIFAIEGQPDRVLRIPLVSEVLADRGVKVDELPRQMLETEPRWSFGRSRIVEASPTFEYLVATRVHGKITGDRFLEQMSFPTGDSFFEMRSDFKWSTREEPKWKNRMAMRVGDSILLGLLWIEAYREIRKVAAPLVRKKLMKLLYAVSLHPCDPKQFVWNEKVNNWTLVDWE